MQPISTEMRKRILDALNCGMTWATTAQKWSISQPFIAKLESHHKLLRQIVTETPDATLTEIQDLLPVKVRHQTVVNALKKLKLV